MLEVSQRYAVVREEQAHEFTLAWPVLRACATRLGQHFPDGFFTEWDDALDAAGADWIATQDAVILGRRSYDEWVGFWPGSEIEPFATFINTVPK
jgi:hypothetical protein